MVPTQSNRREAAAPPLIFRLALLGAVAALPLVVAAQQAEKQRTFQTPEQAVQALAEAARRSDLDQLLLLFGRDARDLIDPEPAVGRQNREVFTAAFAQRWRLEDQGASHKVLVVGNEDWPFPIPLVKETAGWRFDTAAGKEEVLARRIGRNELAVIGICQAYVGAQQRYAKQGHDGKPSGLYAQSFHSDPGKENGLYWPVVRGRPRSPLGDLVAQATAEGRDIGASAEPTPFHGYYFRILTAQGKDATGGEKSYIVNGEMSGGFALIAWPAEYDVSGVMTFIVNQDGSVRQKDLGPRTADLARALTAYNPDSSWQLAR